MEQGTKLTWRENRTLAIVVLCVAVLLSVVGIGSAQVQRVAGKVRTLYADTMQEDYVMRAQAAEGIINVAVTTEGITEAVLQDAQKSVEQAFDALNPTEQFAASNAMQTKVGLLYEEMRAALGEEKGGVLQTQWSEFLSRGNILGKSAPKYNEEARIAQKKLSGFPATLLANFVHAEVSQYA